MNVDRQPVLVTGANGFLGSWILARLIAAGCPVIASDLKRDTRRLDNLLEPVQQEAIRWRNCDVSDDGAVDDLVRNTNPATIIHLAALQIPACRANPNHCVQVNIGGQINILEAARNHGVPRVIYTSSVAAKPRGPSNAPGNLYGVFKKTAEEVARLYWEEHGIRSLGLRPYIVYGVGRDEGETSAITKAIRAAALGEGYTMPFATRSCMQYAGEVADIFCQCVSADWEGALLSDLTTELHSTDELLEAIFAEVPDANIKPSDAMRISPTQGFDNSPLIDVIGDWPRTSLVDGIRMTIRQFQALAERNCHTAPADSM